MLLSPVVVATFLLVFAQLRLRSHLSLASWLLNGLTFFLPPEDALIATLNGHPPPKGATTATGSGHPLSAADKLDQFYVRVAKTEPGVFNQALFFELYEMLVVLVSSSSVGYWSGAVGTFAAHWLTSATTDDQVNSNNNNSAAANVDVATYTLLSALLVALWFPLQLHFAQGWAGYEARLGLAIGFVGLVLAGFVILSPKEMLDFDLERAAHLVGARLALILRAVGFMDADFVNIAPIAEAAKVLLFLTCALVAGVFTCTTFLPSFRFARMYSEMVNDKRHSRGKKLLLHLNLFFPVLICALWVPQLSKHVLVPRELVKCSPRALTRDCLQDDVLLGLDTAATTSRVWQWYSLTESQFHTLRLYVVFTACLVRLLCFRSYVQHFLLEPREVMASLVGRPGVVDGALLQSKVRIQFNYVPIIALQYLAPVCALLASVQLLMKQTATSLGFSSALVWLVQRVAPGLSIPAALTPTTLHAASMTVLPDATTLPNFGGFRLGHDLTSATVTPFVRGMSEFPVLTAEFYEAALGFVIWFLSFVTFGVSLAGLLYWRNVAAHGSTNIEQSVVRQNKQTPKALKNQLKHLKLKKHK
ncbi:unnamed protein product [Hyaloperonospora brassicae]|uniref:Transmembrane protein n=1 Tax=Hyaloperonospora brassicae TaxID=162125 RepID=A0AAV0UVI9_HYABA|nr:unnamed protein product [Hyaloperonospora brassicae]